LAELILVRLPTETAPPSPPTVFLPSDAVKRLTKLVYKLARREIKMWADIKWLLARNMHPTNGVISSSELLVKTREMEEYLQWLSTATFDANFIYAVAIISLNEFNGWVKEVHDLLRE
jgi:hypothetical protein